MHLRNRGHIWTIAKKMSLSKLGIPLRFKTSFAFRQLLQHNKSLIRPCLKHCCHILGSSPSPELTPTLESLAICCKVAYLSLLLLLPWILLSGTCPLCTFSTALASQYSESCVCFQIVSPLPTPELNDVQFPFFIWQAVCGSSATSYIFNYLWSSFLPKMDVPPLYEQWIATIFWLSFYFHSLIDVCRCCP